MKDKLNPFHLAIPISNLEESVIYYRDILGLEEEEAQTNGLTLIFWSSTSMSCFR